MDVAQKRARYRQVRETGLAIADKALAENRPLTEPEVKQLNELVGEGKQLAGEIEAARLGAPDELMGKLKAFAATPAAWSDDPADQLKDGETTLGLKDGERPHPWALAIEQASRARGEEAFAAPSGSIPLPAISTVPFSIGQLGTPLVAAIGLRAWPGGDSGRAVTYLRQTGRTNRAAIWHRGTASDGSDTTAKPVSDLLTVAVVANTETIAHLASPVKTEDLADFASLDQWVASELQYGVLQALESAVLTAPGPEPAMTGLLHLTGVTPVAAAADIPSTIAAGAGGARLRRRPPGRHQPD